MRQQNNDQYELRTIRELAQELHVSTKQLRAWKKQHVLEPIKVAGMRAMRYTHEAVDNFLNQCTINKKDKDT